MAYTNGNSKFARYNGLYEWELKIFGLQWFVRMDNGKFAGHIGLYKWKWLILRLQWLAQMRIANLKITMAIQIGIANIQLGNGEF